jgi:hypothetical protein
VVKKSDLIGKSDYTLIVQPFTMADPPDNLAR